MPQVRLEEVDQKHQKTRQDLINNLGRMRKAKNYKAEAKQVPLSPFYRGGNQITDKSNDFHK